MTFSSSLPLQAGSGHHTVILDEAQDCSDAIVDLVMRQVTGRWTELIALDGCMHAWVAWVAWLGG